MSQVQMNLFGEPGRETVAFKDHMPPFQRQSDTSRAGARKIKSAATGLRLTVLEALKRAGPVSDDGESGGATMQELAGIVSEMRGTATKVSTICGRIGELKNHRLVYDSGMRRMGNAGVKVVVWVSWDHQKKDGL